MRTKNTTINKIKPNDKLFKDKQVGRLNFKGLKHKNGTPFSDLDYFELLGRECIELDKKNSSKVIPTDYGNYDREVVQVAKEIVKGLDNGISKDDLNKYLQRCIDIEK